jgi:HAD superfamily hydrolase (TIGR01509 family)
MVAEGRLPPRPGVARIIQSALEAGWTLAVASTSAQASVEAILRHVAGAENASRFAVFAGDVVRSKKPAPDIYLLAIEKLHADRADALVIEDSRNGLLAAAAAGLTCLVTVSGYTADENFDEAELVVSDLGDPDRPMTVLVNRSAAMPHGWIELKDLSNCLAHKRDFARAGLRM